MARVEDVGGSAGRLRVAFVCQWYQPEPVTQPGWIVDGLRDRGVRVEVLTGVPNYPDGRAAFGYRAWQTRTERVDGVTVHRTPLYPSHDRRTLGRMANYVSWAVSSALLGQRHLRSADVALVYSSPATAAGAAWLARKRAGVPYVLLIQDLWPDSVFASGFLTGWPRRLVEGLLDRMVRGFYASASRVLVISPGMVDVLAGRGVPRDKIGLVYNWIPTEPPVAAASSLREELGIPQNDFVIMYAGNHGAAQSLDSVIRGVALLPEDLGVHLVLVGDGVEKARLVDLATAEAPSRVHFVAPVARELIGSMMAAAQAHLVSLSPDPLFKVTMPSKLQSILAAGLPVIACGEGDVTAVVAEAGAGVTCAPGDPTDFARAALALRDRPATELEEMGDKGLRYYEQHMSAAVGSARLLHELETAVAEGPTRRPARRGRWNR